MIKLMLLLLLMPPRYHSDVPLYVVRGDGRAIEGYGVVVRHGKLRAVLTARHVVHNGGRIYARHEKTKKWVLTKLIRSHRSDLALLLPTKSLGIGAATVGSRPDTLASCWTRYASGPAHYGDWSMEFNRRLRSYGFDSRHGMSGSGIYCGRALVGIVSRADGRKTFSPPTATIREFIGR